MKDIINELKNSENLTLSEIIAIANEHKTAKDNDFFYFLACRALELGENFYAYDIAEKMSEDDILSKTKKYHIMALSLARSGSIHHASELLNEIPNNDDTEIIGLKSRILKDLALKSHNLEQKKNLFKMAGDLSLNIFMAKKRYYNGINAASCLFCANQKDFAKKLVKEEILPLCKMEENQDDMWLLATFGEAYLLIEDYKNALEFYKKAANIAVLNGQAGNLASTLKQFFMLSEYLDKNETDNIVKNLNLPSVAVFKGCSGDEFLNKTTSKLNEEDTRQNISSLIKKHNILFGYSSCLSLSDIIFLEEILNNGGECYVMPPLPIEKTIKKYINSNEKERFEKILDNKKCFCFEAECDEVQDKNDEVIYEFINKFLFGLALKKANSLHFPFFSIQISDENKISVTEDKNG